MIPRRRWLSRHHLHALILLLVSGSTIFDHVPSRGNHLSWSFVFAPTHTRSCATRGGAADLGSSDTTRYRLRQRTLCMKGAGHLPWLLAPRPVKIDASTSPPKDPRRPGWLSPVRAISDGAASLLGSSAVAKLPIKALNSLREPPKRTPFDLDVAIFLAQYAFEAYRTPGRLAWEVHGPNELRFQSGELVSKVFPGLLTVSLLAVEGLSADPDSIDGNRGSLKRGKVVNPCITVSVADKRMQSGTQTSTKRLLPGGRFWGETFSIHVHDPASSVLEVGVWEAGDQGPIPLRDSKRTLVSKSRVLLAEVLPSMLRDRQHSWTGWIDMDETNLVDTKDRAATDVVNGRNGIVTRHESDRARLQFNLHYTPMETLHSDVPTAPRPSDEELEAVGVPSSELNLWQHLVPKVPDEAKGPPEEENDQVAHMTKDGNIVEAASRRGPRTSDLSGVLKGNKDAVPPVPLREDGMPDWSVLTARGGERARRADAFEMMCFLENDETDTEVVVWRDEEKKQLLVSFRGTQAWKDVLTDANFLLDELDREVGRVIPAPEDIVAAMVNTTSSWKKERVKPLPETLGEQKDNILKSVGEALDTSKDLLADLQSDMGNDSSSTDAPSSRGRNEEGHSMQNEDAAADPAPDGTAKGILRAVQKIAQVGGVEPASAADKIAGGDKADLGQDIPGSDGDHSEGGGKGNRPSITANNRLRPGGSKTGSSDAGRALSKVGEHGSKPERTGSTDGDHVSSGERGSGDQIRYREDEDAVDTGRGKSILSTVKETFSLGSGRQSASAEGAEETIDDHAGSRRGPHANGTVTGKVVSKVTRVRDPREARASPHPKNVGSDRDGQKVGNDDARDDGGARDRIMSAVADVLNLGGGESDEAQAPTDGRDRDNVMIRGSNDDRNISGNVLSSVAEAFERSVSESARKAGDTQNAKRGDVDGSDNAGDEIDVDDDTRGNLLSAVAEALSLSGVETDSGEARGIAQEKRSDSDGKSTADASDKRGGMSSTMTRTFRTDVKEESADGRDKQSASNQSRTSKGDTDSGSSGNRVSRLSSVTGAFDVSFRNTSSPAEHPLRVDASLSEENDGDADDDSYADDDGIVSAVTGAFHMGVGKTSTSGDAKQSASGRSAAGANDTTANGSARRSMTSTVTEAFPFSGSRRSDTEDEGAGDTSPKKDATRGGVEGSVVSTMTKTFQVADNDTSGAGGGKVSTSDLSKRSTVGEYDTAGRGLRKHIASKVTDALGLDGTKSPPAAQESERFDDGGDLEPSVRNDEGKVRGDADKAPRGETTAGASSRGSILSTVKRVFQGRDAGGFTAVQAESTVTTDVEGGTTEVSVSGGTSSRLSNSLTESTVKSASTKAEEASGEATHPPGASSGAKRGGLLGRLSKVGRRVARRERTRSSGGVDASGAKGSISSSEDASEKNSTASAGGQADGSLPDGISDTIAWMQQVAGSKVAEGVQEQGLKVIGGNVKALRDIVANVTLPGDDAAEAVPKVHSGFKIAYTSVNKTLGGVIHGATDGRPEDWHVFITGHSLGGALATLAALDHARRYPTARLSMYNFGSPRVGNRAFSELYDSVVGDSFRVVNNKDVVARLPRGTMGRLSLDYKHAGRTVMVTEEPDLPPWVQDESEGACPLDESDPVAALMKPASTATSFFETEIKIMEALFTGKGIEHHLEPNYFSALDSFYEYVPEDDVAKA